MADFYGKEHGGVQGLRHVQGRARTPCSLPSGPDDLPELRPRLLLPAVLPAAQDLPAVPSGHHPAPPDLSQQLSAGPGPRPGPRPPPPPAGPGLQLTPCSSQNSTAHCALGPSPQPRRVPPTLSLQALCQAGAGSIPDRWPEYCGGRERIPHGSRTEGLRREEAAVPSLSTGPSALGQCGSATSHLTGRSLLL